MGRDNRKDENDNPIDKNKCSDETHGESKFTDGRKISLFSKRRLISDEKDCGPI